MVPTARVLGALVLFLVLEWYAATSQVPWLFLLALWVVAVVLAAAVYAAWNRRGVTLHLGVGDARPAPGSPVEALPDHVLRAGPMPAPVFEGDGFGLEVALRSRRGTRGPVWAQGTVGGERIVAATGLVSADGWSRVRSMSAARRGAIGATGWSVGTSDPFGFFRGVEKTPDEEVVVVLPKFASVSGLRQSRELDASVAATRAGSGNELFGIREYRPGDSLRRIHWRSSAKRGELVVREYEPPGVQTLTIALDRDPPSTDIADQMARIAASEAWDCLRDGGRVVLWAPGTEPLPSRDIWSVLEWLARYPSTASSPAEPVIGQDLVTVTAGNQEAADTIELARSRGARVRAWVVGDARFDVDAPVERVGTAWPI